MKMENEVKTVIQSLPQWHASSVACLKFVDSGGPSKMLLSAGRESVLVQWNLSTQDRSFVSRMGTGPITNLEVDGDFEGLYSGDFAAIVGAMPRRRRACPARAASWAPPPPRPPSPPRPCNATGSTRNAAHA